MRNADIHEALMKLDQWVERADWRAYDTFDGLASPYARWFTFDNAFLKQVWQQGVRRFPINLRPLLGIKPDMSTKAMAFFAQGYLRLHQLGGERVFFDRMKFCLEWLMEHRNRDFRGHCWGNHFEYQSRGGNIAKGAPTIVWTGLISHAFLDAYEAFGEDRYLQVARSACDFILDELGWMEFDEGICLQYYPNANVLVHNSSIIGAGLLARVHSLSPNPRYLEMADRAVRFTLHHQTAAGAWYYGVGQKWAWIDSFHSGYVLESLHTFCRCARTDQYREPLERGYRFFIKTFFKPDGTPRYYDHKTMPLDIQCASQGIQTLVNLRELDPRSIAVAASVAGWTIANMQDRTGYFYYRKYPLLTNKTPTLHWGQATMFAALALLDQQLNSPGCVPSAAPVSALNAAPLR